MCMKIVLYGCKVLTRKWVFWVLSAVSYLQNVSPPFLIENIILEVFSVYLLRLLDLLWSHYLS